MTEFAEDKELRYYSDILSHKEAIAMKRNAVFLFIASLLCFALAWKCGTTAIPFMESLEAASTGIEQFSFTIPTGLLVFGTALGIIGGIFFLGAGIGTLKKRRDTKH